MCNAGQTCISPDYVLVTHGRQAALVEAFRKTYTAFYGTSADGKSVATADGKVDVEASESFSRIIAERHFDRLWQILSETKGEIVLGGETRRETKFIAPTIVSNVGPADSLMSQCVFYSGSYCVGLLGVVGDLMWSDGYRMV
jgi:acyl-CoA reductase-like NAD-dependent aldehyde dehydrogenase